MKKGAYYLGLLAVQGNEPTGAGFPRPPLAPGWLLFPFVHYLGFDTGYKVWSVAASMFPAIPVYLIARRVSRIGGSGVSPPSQWGPAFAVGFLLVDWLHAEMFVTGALPMIAFGLLGTAWWAMGSLCEQREITCGTDKENMPQAHRQGEEGVPLLYMVAPFLLALSVLQSSRWCYSIVLTLCIGLIPFVNQTTAGLAVITLPVYGLALLWYHRGSRLGLSFGPQSVADPQRSPGKPRLRAQNVNPSRQIILRLAPPMFVGGVIALTSIKWYMEVLPGSGILDYPGPVIYFTGAYDIAWLQLILGWSLGLLMIRRGEEPWLRALGVLCCLLGTFTVFLSYDESVINLFYRSRYLLAVVWYPGIAWAVFKWVPGWLVRKEKRPVLAASENL